jgi:uncharacterized membrane protein
MGRISESLSGLSPRYRLLISAVVAGVAFLALRGHVEFSTLAIATWDAFAMAVLGLIWISIVETPLQEIRKRVQRQDVAGPWITLFVILAACAALSAVIFFLQKNKGSPQPHLPLHIVLTLIAVLSSWTLVHTVFCLHYAHAFYGDGGEDPKQVAGGLKFPGGNKPDYLDFAYFSFVVGMTFQVSDVQVSSRELRLIVLLHGILSFAFNTIIVALAINTMSSIL